MSRHPGLFVSVVVPLLDDADIVEAFSAELGDVLAAHYTHYEIIFVDDSSSDDTLTRLQTVLGAQVNVRVIPLSRPFGQEIAISAGLDSAIGDFVVVMLPNTDPPALIPAMIDQARDGVGMVFGVRDNRDSDGFFHRLGARCFYALSAAQELPIQRDATHFRVLSREAVNAVTRIRSPKRYLRTLSHAIGFGNHAFPYRQRSLRAHPRPARLPALARLATDIVVTNTTWPLRAASTLALVAAFGAGVYALYVVAVYLFKEQVAEGWATIAGPIALLSAILLLAIGVLGHYVVRLLEAQPDGPLYHALDERNSRLPSPAFEVRNVVTDSIAGPGRPDGA